MSFGERHLIALSSFPNIPDVLLVDEPPYSYELFQMKMIKAILQKYRDNGTGILLSTHYPDFFTDICSKKYRICDFYLEEY